MSTGKPQQGSNYFGVLLYLQLGIFGMALPHKSKMSEAPLFGKEGMNFKRSDERKGRLKKQSLRPQPSCDHLPLLKGGTH